VLREELELVEVPIVDVCWRTLRVDGAQEVDLESLSEFLAVLVAAL
jgi:hypothetical protein